MTNVVSNLMGQRVVVRFRPYDGTAWWDVATGTVRGVSQINASAFAVLLEIEAALGGNDTIGLHYLGMPEVPGHTLVSFGTDARYDGHVAIVVLKNK